MLGGSEIYLDDSKDNFEKGSIDTFILDLPLDKDCGTPVEKVGGGHARMSCILQHRGVPLSLQKDERAAAAPFGLGGGLGRGEGGGQDLWG